MYTRVLFVSGDGNLLNGWKKALAPLRSAWEMSFTQGANEGFAQITAEQPTVLMVDQGMLADGGSNLLAATAERFPRVIRCVLSGASGANVNRGSVPAHHFITFPCTLPVLKNTVDRALMLRNLLAKDNLRELLVKVKELPALPDLYLRVMAELRKPNASLASIGQIIERDVAMSAKVLRLVNSAYFGLPQQVSSPALAVNLLGIESIRSMILLFNVFAQFDRIRAMVPNFNLDALQQHSFAVGSYARTIARYERLPQSSVDSYFMAGLFHDIGKLVLLANMPQQYNEVMKIVLTKRVRLMAAEQQVFGATHAEVGAYLLALWGIPDPVIEAAAFHHTPRRAMQQGVNEMTVVHVANTLQHLTTEPTRPGDWADIDLDFLQVSGLAGRQETWQKAIQETGG